MSTMRSTESLSITLSSYGDEHATSSLNSKKKERFGIFRNLRRRIRSNFQRKSDGNDKNNDDVETVRNSTNARSKINRKGKDQNKSCRLNLCSKPSNSNSSQSTESLDLNLHLHRKVDDNLWPNRERKDSNAKKEKASCRSKDISKFQAACRVPCEPSHSVGAENGECKNCMKINNVSSFSSTHLEITVLCHSNGMQSSSNNPVQYSDYKSSISEGAMLNETPKVWSLTHELFRLSKFGWYWGPITRREAERKLNGQPDGAFLVRDSSDERYLLSLSFRSYGRTLHTRIEHCNGKFIFDAQPDTEGYPSIVDLIENSMNDPQTGICSYSRHGSPSPPIYPVRLTRPVSRFTQVRSLQYMCRFVIRQYTRYDHIQHLPLPKKLKGWIGENQY